MLQVPDEQLIVRRPEDDENKPKLVNILASLALTFSHRFVAVFISALLLDSLQMNNPWTSGLEFDSNKLPVKYVGWHVRTQNGESKASYTPDIHRYIIQEPAKVVCPAFEAATNAAKSTCPELFLDKVDIFVSSNRYRCVQNLVARSSNRVLSSCY